MCTLSCCAHTHSAGDTDGVLELVRGKRIDTNLRFGVQGLVFRFQGVGLKSLRNLAE